MLLHFGMYQSVGHCVMLPDRANYERTAAGDAGRRKDVLWYLEF